MNAFLKVSFLNAFFSIFSKLISFIIVILIARNFSIYEYSIFGQLYSIQQVAITLLSAGYIEIAINESYRTTSQKKKIYKNIIFSAFRATLIFIALFFYISIHT